MWQEFAPRKADFSRRKLLLVLHAFGLLSIASRFGRVYAVRDPAVQFRHGRERCTERAEYGWEGRRGV